MQPIYYKSSSLYKGDYRFELFDNRHEFNHQPHFHDFYEIQFYEECRASMSIGDAEYMVNSGDIVFLRAFQPHGLHIWKSHSNYKRYCFSLNSSFLLNLCTGDLNPLNMFSENASYFPVLKVSEEKFQKFLQLFKQYYAIEDSHAKKLHQRSVVLEIIAKLYDITYDLADHTSEELDKTVLISEIVTYISDHLKENLTLDTISEEVGYSKYYLCRMFKKYTNTTIIQYINMKRIDFTKYLLTNTTKSLQEISQQAGFNNYSCFYKTFFATTGQSPKDYRKESGKKEDTK